MLNFELTDGRLPQLDHFLNQASFTRFEEFGKHFIGKRCKDLRVQLDGDVGDFAGRTIEQVRGSFTDFLLHLNRVSQFADVPALDGFGVGPQAA